MSGGFTPGPWMTDGRLPGSSDYVVFAEDGVACIAFVKPGCLPAKGRNDAAEANARLIAAAPDMHAVTVVLASIPIGPEVVEDRDMVLYRNGAGSITVGDVLNARAALAKSGAVA